MSRSSLRAKIAILILFATTVGCDRVTKRMAESNLPGMGRQSFLGDTVRLEYTENTGAFLGLGADWPPVIRTALFTVGTGAILLGMLVFAIRSPLPGLGLTGLALFIAGGASNLFDRLDRGSVVDFMNVGVGWLRTGIFNVADMAVMGGVALFLITQLRAGPDAPPEAPPAAAAPEVPCDSSDSSPPQPPSAS